MPNLNTHDILNMKSVYGRKLTSAIELAYGLKISNYAPIPEISLTSKKALIKTDQGTFFLKEKPFYSTKPDALFRSFTFQDYCAKNSDRFIEIIKTKDSAYYLDFEGSIYFITRYIKGNSFNGKIDGLFRMLETIIELRKLGENYLKEYINKKTLLPFNKSYEIILPFSLLKHAVVTKEDKKVFSDLKKALKILTEKFDSYERIKYIMSHGDCILFNFQILNDKAILHDFDNAKVLPSMHDVSEFFVSSCLLNYKGSVTNLKLPIFLSCHKNTSTIIAKKIVGHLSKDEISLLPVCIEIIWLWTLMLSVIKEDYMMTDLIPAIEIIFQRKLNLELSDIFNSENSGY